MNRPLSGHCAYTPPACRRRLVRAPQSRSEHDADERRVPDPARGLPAESLKSPHPARHVGMRRPQPRTASSSRTFSCGSRRRAVRRASGVRRRPARAPSARGDQQGRARVGRRHVAHLPLQPTSASASSRRFAFGRARRSQLSGCALGRDKRRSVECRDISPFGPKAPSPPEFGNRPAAPGRPPPTCTASTRQLSAREPELST